MELIKRAWRGEEKLWKVFWLYGFLGTNILNFIIAAVVGSGLVGLIILLPYAVWNLVSCWRCAFNVGAKFWGVLVRILVALGVIGWILSFFAFVVMGNRDMLADRQSNIISGGVGKSNYMINAAKCNAALRQQAEAAGIDPEQYKNDHVAEKERCLKEGIDSMGWNNAQPATSVVPVPAMDACEQKMHDFAVANNVDPKAYIAQNQAYLENCRAAVRNSTSQQQP